MLKLRKTEPGEPLIVSMTGLRLGDRVLFIGCRDPKAVALLALKPGLTGRACAVDEDAERAAKTQKTAEAQGALLEVEVAPLATPPYPDESFDVVLAIRVIAEMTAAVRRETFSAAHRMLRPGGRCIVVDEGARQGLAGLMARGTPVPPGDIQQVLQGADFRAVRTLAERSGLVFVEGARAK